jgi:predicted RNase H-like nuclease (RuvC/YqgF family)
MKILNDNKFTELLAKADNFDRIVAVFSDSVNDVKAEDISADTIIDVLQHISDSDTSELNATIGSLNAQISELQQKLADANARIVELENELDTRPAEQSATIVSKGEPSAKPMDIIDFARKNADNPFLVLEEMKKQQLI